MRIEDLKRQYLATHPDGLWFKNGGRKYGRWFPTRTVYGGKYFVEGTPDVLTYKVWEVQVLWRQGERHLTPKITFRLAGEFIFLALALDHARKLAKESA
jgi:hypothetical protein